MPSRRSRERAFPAPRLNTFVARRKGYRSLPFCNNLSGGGALVTLRASHQKILRFGPGSLREAFLDLVCICPNRSRNVRRPAQTAKMYCHMMCGRGRVASRRFCCFCPACCLAHDSVLLGVLLGARQLGARQDAAERTYAIPVQFHYLVNPRDGTRHTQKLNTNKRDIVPPLGY